MGLIYPNHVKILRPERLINRQKTQILEPQSSVWALEFSKAVANRVAIPDGTSDLNFTTKLSICLDVKFNSSAGAGEFQCLICKLPVNQAYLLFWEPPATNSLVFRISTAGGNKTFTIGFTPTVGIWYTFFVTYDNDKIRFYVNGDLFATSASFPGPILTTVGDLYLGNFSNATVGAFDGQMSTVATHNRVFSAQEIKNFQEQILQPDDLPDLVGWWRFQEGFGSANGTRIRDWSERNNHGAMNTFNANPWVSPGVM